VKSPHDLVVVFVSQGPLRAEVARSKLESNNIPAMLRYSAVGRAFGITINGLGEVHVLVRARDATAARALLEEVADQDWSCGSAEDGQVDEPHEPSGCEPEG